MASDTEVGEDERTNLVDRGRRDSASSTESSWKRRFGGLCSKPSKSRLVCACGSVWGLFTGMERAVIFPTLWLYLVTYFDAETAVRYYGATLSAFSLTILFSSPIYGYLSRRGVPVRILLLVSDQLEVIGNVLYMIGSRPWVILLGRFIAGLGGGSEVSLYADVVRCTTKQERTPIISMLLMFRQFGLIIGPAITLALDPFKFSLGQIQFSVYNLPGLFMAIMWSIHTVMLMLFYPSAIKSVEQDEVLVENETSSIDTMSEDLELQTQNPEDLSLRQLIRYYIKQETIATLLTTFAAYFSLMALEAILPPLVKQTIDWNEFETSIVYVVSGVTVIFMYLLVRWLSARYQDRQLLLVGQTIVAANYLYIMAIVLVVKLLSHKLLIVFIMLGIVVHVIGMPFNFVCAESLYSKCIPVFDIDRGQTIIRFAINVSVLLGPLVGGLAIEYAYLVFGAMALLFIVSMACTARAYSKLNR